MEKIHTNISKKTLEAKDWYRDEIDLLHGRLDLLKGKDKVLMTMYLENDNSFRQIAQLIGISETSIARRIRGLTKRLADGQYITCLRNRNKFTEFQINIAKDYFLFGLSIKEIANIRWCSFYRIRKTIKEIKSIIKDEITD